MSPHKIITDILNTEEDETGEDLYLEEIKEITEQIQNSNLSGDNFKQHEEMKQINYRVGKHDKSGQN